MGNVNPRRYEVNTGVHKINRCVSADMQHVSMEERLYLHLDMNCSYAQIEQLSYNLYGMPIIDVNFVVDAPREEIQQYCIK